MRIPGPTSNQDQIRQDLARAGVAIVDDALTPEEVAAARSRVETIAQQERRSGLAILEDGSPADGSYRPGVNQRVVSLVVKDALFGRLATNPVLLSVARALFASSYPYPEAIIHEHGFDRLLLASMTANIANPGGREMQLHADQGFAPPATPFPILVNAVLPLVDFTADNGATRVAPGTHLADPTVLNVRPPDTQPVEATAGSAIIIDGRTWHGTGTNRTDQARPAILLNYCPPWVRPFANHGLEVDDSFLETAPAEVLRLLGFEPWFVFGASETRQLDRTRLTSADRVGPNA